MATAFVLALWLGGLSFHGSPAFAQPFYSYPVGAEPVSIAAGDLNHDGRPDLVTSNHSPNSVSVLLNRGAGRFDRLPGIALASWAGQVTIADLNGDGIPDLVVAGDLLSVLLGNGDGTFRPPTVYTSYSSSVVVGDVNRDGRPTSSPGTTSTAYACSRVSVTGGSAHLRASTRTPVMRLRWVPEQRGPPPRARPGGS